MLEALGAAEKPAHEEYQDDDWVDSQTQKSVRRRRSAPNSNRRKTAPPLKAKQRKRKEEIVVDSSDDAAKPGKDKDEVVIDSSDHANEGESSESDAPIVVAKRRSPNSAKSSSTRIRRSIQESSSSNSEDETVPAKRESPKRSSAIKAKQRFSTINSDESSSSTMENVKPAARRPAARKSTGIKAKRLSRSRDDDDSDGEFDPDAVEAEESSVDEASDLEEESSSDDVREVPLKHQKRSPQKGSPKRRDSNRRGSIGVVKDGDVGVADDSSDDSIVASPPPKLHLQRSPQRRSPKNPPKRQQKAPPKENSHESAEESDSSTSARPKDVPQCDSKLDVITGEKLPKVHVCFFTPDQRSCQCFALETLRKIALSASAPQYRKDNAGREVQTFLQPPHFRTPMSDDLLDQIASRFGRDALKIHGSYYRRQAMEIPAAATDWSSVNMPVLPDQNDDFHDQLQQYIRKSMGSQDVYTCPLCYIVAHSRLSSDDTDVPYETEFDKDPMAVLGFLDNDNFTVASAFCFRKVAELKEHVREDHDVKTTGIEGNAFYARYKVCWRVVSD